MISDLAVMMLTAGIIMILFKKIRQPLVLGYILAGFLMSPYFPLFMTVEDTGNIHAWSEIGIIFLMFHLGLEFNLHKLAQVGSTAIVTTMIEVAGVLGIGFATGMALGFTVMDSVCLGGMLSMSSTTVIIKVFDEMNLKGKKCGDGLRYAGDTGHRRHFYDGDSFYNFRPAKYIRRRSGRQSGVDVAFRSNVG